MLNKRVKNQGFSHYVFLGKNRKASHVGVIVSFAIFVVFSFYVYTTLQPAIRVERGKEALLDYLKVEIINQASANMVIATVFITKTSLGNSCVEIFHSNDINPADRVGVVVKKEPFIDTLNDYGFDDSKVRWPQGRDKVFRIYYSSEAFALNPAPTDPSDCDPLVANTDYNFLITQREYVFESKIYRLIDKYNDDYASLESELNIPDGSDFGFNFIGEGIDISLGEDVSTNIYAEEIPIIYVDAQSNIKQGFLTIKVW